MKVGIYCTEGLALWAARRMQDEGHDVAMYYGQATDSIDGKGPHPFRLAGAGIVKIVTSAAALSAHVGKDGLIIFDGSGCGNDADALRRRGHLVFGGGSFCERLEGRRLFAEGLAKRSGLLVPPTHPFAKISETIAFAKKHPDKTYYFKSNKRIDCAATCSAKTPEGFIAYLEFTRRRYGDNISNILQEKIEGVAISTAFYWNGKVIVWPLEATVEHKKFMNDEVGPATGCSVNVVWFYSSTPQIGEMLKLAEVERSFRVENAPPGLYDINAIITKDGRAYFLEWTPRFGYDSEPTSQALIHGDYAETLYALAAGTIDAIPAYTDTDMSAFGLRVAIPPYPWEAHDDLIGKNSVVGAPVIFPTKKPSLWKQFVAYGIQKVGDEYQVSNPGGLLGVVVTTGADLKSMNRQALGLISKMDIKDLMYRTDGDKLLGKDLAILRRYGLEVPDLI